MMYRTFTSLATLTLLSACAGFMPAAQVPMAVAPAWQTPLPHQRSVAALSDWWARQGDPVLVALIEAAQAQNPSVAQAVSRIATARANQAAAFGALMPNLNAQASASRGQVQGQGAAAAPIETTLQGGLQASWELDLVGANRAVNRAAQAQLEGSQAQWHDARVSVAAEVASLYHSHATCQQQLTLAQQDAASRQETARVTGISAKAGFVAPSVAAMARASAAESNSRLIVQTAACEIDLKALVALTAIPEPDLKQKLAINHVNRGAIALFSVASLPAQTVSQRPDVFAAERDVVLASAQVGSAKAQRWPRLTLNGSIGSVQVRSDAGRGDGTTWSFGPLAVSLPLFDGGQRAANVDAAQANYQAVVSNYQSKVRHAVREVEEALIQVQSAQARTEHARVATQGFAQSLAATQSRSDQGLASLLELEDARRSALSAQSSELALGLEQKRAWINLYRAVGGGFEPDKLNAQTTPVALSQ